MSYRVHFEDDYGQGSFDVETFKQALISKQDLDKDPKTFNVWIEDLKDDEF